MRPWAQIKVQAAAKAHLIKSKRAAAVGIADSQGMFMASPASLGYIKMIELHDYVQFFLVIILFFVLWFYANILLDFGAFNTQMLPADSLEKAYTHVLARKIAHIGWLEVVWTIIPILILTAIAIPSFKLLYALDVVNSPLLTLRCIGNQWYWTYECEIVKPDFTSVFQKVVAKADITGLSESNIFMENDDILKYESRYMFLPDTEYLDLLDEDLIFNMLFQQEYIGYYEADATYAVTYFIEFDEFIDSVETVDIVEIAENSDMTTTDLDGDVVQVEDSSVDWDPVTHIDGGLMQGYTHISISDSSITLIKEEIMEHVFDFDMDMLEGGDLLNNQNSVRITQYVERILIKYNADADSFAVDSYMLDADELQLGAFRLLEVDNYPQLPADAEIRLAITGTDVIHSFAVPSLGVKVDAIPGRLNQFGIRVRSPGIYYGQCSELCGVGHGFMPIKVQFIKVIK
jgi:heme/copper-type cytochrome/quinol oxidase subunit 2